MTNVTLLSNKKSYMVQQYVSTITKRQAVRIARWESGGLVGLNKKTNARTIAEVLAAIA